MVIPSADRTYTFGELCRPGAITVYAWLRNGEWLYVGCSSQGLARVLNHNTIGRRAKTEPTDEIRVWYFADDWFVAANFEMRLIQKHRPKYNVIGNTERPIGDKPVDKECLACGDQFRPNRWWQKYCSYCGSGGKAEDRRKR